MTLSVILLLIAVVLFGVAAAGVASRVNLTALGLAFFAGSFLVSSL